MSHCFPPLPINKLIFLSITHQSTHILTLANHEINYLTINQPFSLSISQFFFFVWTNILFSLPISPSFTNLFIAFEFTKRMKYQWRSGWVWKTFGVCLVPAVCKVVVAIVTKVCSTYALVVIIIRKMSRMFSLSRLQIIII